MRILVTGSRDFTNRPLLVQAFNELGLLNPVIIHGQCPDGADSMAQAEAHARGWWVWSCPANWSRYGSAAGPKRNQRMLDEAQPQVVLAFPLPGSVGTRDMMWRAEKANVPIRIYKGDQ